MTFYFTEATIAEGWTMCHVYYQHTDGERNLVGSYGLSQVDDSRVVGRSKSGGQTYMAASGQPFDRNGLDERARHKMACALLVGALGAFEAELAETVKHAEATDKRLSEIRPARTATAVTYGDVVRFELEATTWGQLDNGDQVVTDYAAVWVDDFGTRTVTDVLALIAEVAGLQDTFTSTRIGAFSDVDMRPAVKWRRPSSDPVFRVVETIHLQTDKEGMS